MSGRDTGPASVGTLLEALPYIREFHGRTVVIKYGGAAMRDDGLRDAFATDVVLLKYVGLNPVIVHGGGPEITRYMERLGLEVRFVEGMRVSDPETVEVAKMVLLGKVNADIVARLNRHGQPAVGLSGEDGALFTISPHERADQVGFVGEIERVDVDVLNHIAADYIPVIASAGVDREGNSYNVNADTAAGKVAAALRAHKAIFLTDVRGWLADPSRRGIAALAGERRRGRGRPRARRRRHAPEARGVRRGDPRRRRLGPHHRRAPGRTRCCSSCSPTPASGRWSLRERRRAAGARGALRDADLRAGAGRVRARRGRSALGLATVASTSTSSPGSRSTTRATATRGSSPRSRAGRAARRDARTSTTRSRRCGSASGSRDSSLGGRVFLANSGTEASECAIKLVRKRAHARGIAEPEIVSLDGGFHGRTLAALAATPRLAREDLFGPLPGGFVAVARDDPEALRAAVCERTAAVLIEPIQGEAGIFPIADEVLIAAREACDAAGAALVFDEVQTGIGQDRDPVGLRAAPGRART